MRGARHGDRETGACHICGQVFPTQEELSKHLMDAHADGGLSDACLRSRTDAAKTTAQGSFELLPRRRTVLKRYSDPRHLRAVQISSLNSLDAASFSAIRSSREAMGGVLPTVAVHGKLLPSI